jgi:predicted NAD/FAD-binding protein
MEYLNAYESWSPRFRDFLEGDNLKDIDIIKQYVDYQSINPIVIDIWMYAYENFGNYGNYKYPRLIDKGGVQYVNKRGEYIDIKFEGSKSTISLTQNNLNFRPSLHGSRPVMSSNVLKSGEFTFKLFKNMFDENFVEKEQE